MRLIFLTSVLAPSVIATMAFGQTQDCSKALIVAYENSNSSIVLQLSSAYKMSEGEWSQRKAGGDLNAVIYDVPVGASYSQFQSNVRQRAQEFHLERFEQRAYSFATSGLNDASLQAYKACLQSTQGGFYIFSGDMSEEAYKIHLLNSPVTGLDPSIVGRLDNPINLSEESIVYLKLLLSKLKYATSFDKEIHIVPKDISKEVSFTVDFGDIFDRDILLPPLKRKPIEVEISDSSTFSVMHRVKGVPNPDCALSTPEKGGEGGHQPNYVLDERAYLYVDREHYPPNFDSMTKRNLPSTFKIDPSTVSISVPGQSCAWVTCWNASEAEASDKTKNIVEASQCKPLLSSTSYYFRVRIACPNAYDDTCSDHWTITGRAIEDVR